MAQRIYNIPWDENTYKGGDSVPHDCISARLDRSLAGWSGVEHVGISRAREVPTVIDPPVQADHPDRVRKQDGRGWTNGARFVLTPGLLGGHTRVVLHLVANRPRLGRVAE